MAVVDSGRHVVASLSSDVKGESNRGGAFSAMSAVTNPGVKPQPRAAPKPRPRPTNMRRYKLTHTPRETSHGFAMQHAVHERPKGETPSYKRPEEVHRKRREDPEQKQMKVVSLLLLIS